MRCAQVILDIQTQALDQAYTYRVPDRITDSAGTPVELQVGMSVVVPFGSRDAIGFVMSVFDGEAPEGRHLKVIRQVASVPFFNQIGADCAQFMASRYVAPLSSCVRLFTPPGGVPKMKHLDGRWQVLTAATHEVDDRWVVRLPAADDFVPRKNSVKQIAVLVALDQGDLKVADLTAEYGNVTSTLKSLESKGVVRIEERRRFRGQDSESQVFAARAKTPVELTADQERALEAIRVSREHAGGRAVVVDGVTGSGKTEVYLRAIAAELERGKNAIVLVPEISLTPQTLARFRGRFGDTVAVLHSRMTPGERFDQWELIRTGAARVVVGARSALFAPVPNLGLIVVDEEHEGSYKQDQAPRYVTRDVAWWLACRSDASLVLGSATPSIETLAACKEDERWVRVEMPNRANGKPLPPVRIVNMGGEFGGGNRSMFSKALQKALFEEIEAGHKAVFLLNQRGFAKFLLCRDCGFVPECDRCSTSLTFHERGNVIVCHHCGHVWQAPAVCPKCGSPYLKRFGAGTQRVEDELRALLDGREASRETVIVRMDADTAAKKGDHQRLLEEFAEADSAVLLGTQMIAKGLDFDEVTLVGVINADTMLKLPDFRAGERTFDLLSQVAGRCGRGDLPGRVIVQTYNPQDVAIRSAATYDRQRFLDHELRLRQGLGYPPYVRLANILLWGRNKEAVEAQGQQLFFGLMQRVREEGAADWVVYPATPCVLDRLKGVWRYHLLVKVPKESAVPDPATVLLPYFRARKADKDVNVSVDIDPVSLL